MLRLASLLCIFAVTLTASQADDWPQFRGPQSAGSASSVKLPVEWDLKKDIAWKVDLPGRSASSPIVVNGRVICTAASGYRSDRLHVLCHDAKTGKKRWHRQFWATGRTLTHPVSSVAANTPVSDGKHVYAFFSSCDLVCLDLDGNVKWVRGITHDYPTVANDVGMASSPIVVDGVVVVQMENEVNSVAMGVSAADGRELWKIKRPRRPGWCSPAVLGSEEKPVVLLQSARYISAHHPQSGKELWRHETKMAGISSPVAFRGDVLAAAEGGLISLTQKGSTKEAEVVWEANKLNCGSASPVVHRGKVYALGRSGVLSCGDASTGEVLWQLRTKGPYWATPVAVGDYLYCCNNDGVVFVVELGEKGKVAAKNDLAEKIFGTPAVADGGMFIQTQKQLWKVRGK